MERIISSDNVQIKTLKKLARRRHREENHEFTVENLTIIQDALASGHDFKQLFVTDDFLNKHKEKLDNLVSKSPESKKYLISNKINNSYSQLDTPSGITAVYEARENKLKNSEPLIYLNGIADPGNLGTIMRTALAFGFNNIVVDEVCADIYNAKTINAARDAIFKINLFRDKNCEWLEKNKASIPIYSTSSHEGILLDDFHPAGIFCLVLGSESHGVSEEIRQLADEKIKISISDKIESLNVAAAAAILMYQLRKIN